MGSVSIFQKIYTLFNRNKLKHDDSKLRTNVRLKQKLKINGSKGGQESMNMKRWFSTLIKITPVGGNASTKLLAIKEKGIVTDD